MIGTLVFAILALVLLGLAWASWVVRDRLSRKPENDQGATTLTFIPPRSGTDKPLTRETLHLALALSDRIDELRRFRQLLDRINGRDTDNRVFLRIVRETRIRLGADFFFGVGRNIQTVDVPGTLYKRIRQLAAELQAELEYRLEAFREKENHAR
jgi:hypothetical protein